jgi:hypothetical protein
MTVTGNPPAANSGPHEPMQQPHGLTQITGVHVPGARVGQVVTIDGAGHRVTEINLARPDHPVLVPVADAEASMDGGK